MATEYRWFDGLLDQEYLIGGSYSLWKFLKFKTGTQEKTWTPSDIDVFVNVQGNKNDQDTITTQLQHWQQLLGPKTTLTKLSYNDYYDWSQYGQNNFVPKVTIIRNIHKEDFDTSIVAVGTFTNDYFPKKFIQIILVDSRVYGLPNLLETLNKIADIKVFYKYDLHKKKIWYCQPENEKMILNKILLNLCLTRTNKYQQRGFNVKNT